MHPPPSSFLNPELHQASEFGNQRRHSENHSLTPLLIIPQTHDCRIQASPAQPTYQCEANHPVFQLHDPPSGPPQSLIRHPHHTSQAQEIPISSCTPPSSIPRSFTTHPHSHRSVQKPPAAPLAPGLRTAELGPLISNAPVQLSACNCRDFPSWGLGWLKVGSTYRASFQFVSI